jgi:uncharacterized membrane protein YfcA
VASLAVGVALLAVEHAAAQPSGPAAPERWWVWPIGLFLVTLLLGVLAVIGGLGGGTIFVPVVSGFFPFHIDYVRAAGLFVALASALAAGPDLLRRNLADLRLALPISLAASASAIVGARVGLRVPGAYLHLALGMLVLGIVAIMAVGRGALVPDVRESDPLSRLLGIGSGYWDEAMAARVEWRVHRTWLGLVLFLLIGLVGGMFGVGAGWANVPVLNLLMGVPLKVAVGTSVFTLSVTATSAAWVYLHDGAVLPLVVVPSVVGMMLGAWVGVKLLIVLKPEVVRRVVLAVLAFAGLRTFVRGIELW